MEKPLDLSNREDEFEGKEDRIDGFPSRDEPICQLENCNCPLKHIIQLGNQNKSSNGNSGMESYNDKIDPNQYPFYSQFISSHYSKRQFETSEFCNPKRRRVNMYNSETAQCASGNSASTSCAAETSATSYCEGNRFDLPQANGYYRPYNIPVMDCAVKDDKMDGKAFSNPNDLAFDTQVQPTGINTFHNRKTADRNIAPVHMLPKKRGVRRYSPDPEQEQGSSSQDANGKPFIGRHSPLSRSQSQTVVGPPSSSLSSENETKSKYDAKSIKADMIREIDSQKDDDEDVQTFRRKLFDSFMKSNDHNKDKVGVENKAPPVEEKKKQEEEVTHTNPMTSLDYLISKTLMESEDKPFKPRNNHIHEIISGEKRGRLCLMDLVELQVEIGLA